jgi:D-alanyl-D-alanine carboxypeptidase (penicillin-binding protein 5/6)
MTYMIRTSPWCLITNLLLLVLFSSQGLGADQIFEPPPFQVRAKAAVLKNVRSGQVLYEQNPHERFPPASLTKLMSLYLAYESLKEGRIALDDPVLVSKKAWRTGGSKMFVEVGKKVALSDLIKGVSVVSGNDASVAVAEYLAGVEEVFAMRMNETAKRLGMADTHFANASGLPAKDQYTSALDMALLASRYVDSFPEALEVHSMKSFEFNGISQRNRNGLLWLDAGVDGLKTGWINAAGYHLVATAARDGDRYVAVVMGAVDERTRENEALKLIEYGFRNFVTANPFKDEDSKVWVDVWKGRERKVAARPQSIPFVTVPVGKEGLLSVERDVSSMLFAPVEQGAVLGKVVVLLGGERFKEVDLLAQQPVPQAGFLTRTFHAFILSFVLPPRWGFVFLSFIVLAFLIWIYLKVRKPARGQRA